MKKAIIVFALALLVLAAVGIWIFSGSSGLKSVDLVSFGVIILVLGFAVFVGYKRLSNVRRGEPTEDEMSNRILRKTSSVSYYISLYLWLIIMYFSDKLDYETHTIIGTGILGMAVTFAICWLVINFSGIRNE